MTSSEPQEVASFNRYRHPGPDHVATLASTTVTVVGSLAGLPAVATELAAFPTLALIFGVGLYITYWKSGQ